MGSPYFPPDEQLRLGQLARYNVALDEKEDLFCDLAKLAAAFTNAPFAGVSLVDDTRVWLKGRVGVDLSYLERSGAFCAYAVDSSQELFIVPDTTLDSRFIQNPLVTNVPHIRSYAAAVLSNHQGYMLGTLWIMDTKPRGLSTAESEALLGLANQVMRILELRYQNPQSHLPNRPAFISNLQCALNKSRGSQACRFTNCTRNTPEGGCLSAGKAAPCIVGYIHLQNMALINSAWGRDTGDALFAQLVGKLSDVIGHHNMLSHLTDNSLAFALFDNTVAAKIILDHLWSTLTETYQVNDYVLRISASIGVSHHPESGSNAAALLDQATTAASPIVASLLGGIQNYQNQSNVLGLTQFQRTFHKLIQQEQFRAYYQPQVDVQTNRVIGFEALARLHHSELGIQFPDSFIPMAEKCGLIREVDLEIFERVCKDLGLWIKQGLPVLPVAINLSRTSLMYPELIATLDSILAKHRVPMSLIEIEITESGFADSPELVGERINALHNHGYFISIDDFGTGLSNLAALKTIHFDLLKADRQYVHGVSTNVHTGGILRLIHGVAEVFNVETLCEGLEDPSDLEWIRQIGCKYVQGWYFAKALPAETIPELFQKLEIFYSSSSFATHDSVGLANCLQSLNTQ